MITDQISLINASCGYSSVDPKQQHDGGWILGDDDKNKNKSIDGTARS